MMQPSAGLIIKSIMRRVPAVKQLLTPATLALAAKAEGIDSLNADYHDAITDALVSYLEGGSVSGPRSRFRRAMVQAFGDAFELGWVDGGAELPFEGEALEWYNARVEQEMGFIDALFQQAKQLRKDKEFDAFAWATARADGYTGTILSIYNAAVLFAKKNQLLTWHLGATETHCSTCASLNNKRHPAYWYIARDYIPRKAGAAMDCQGYNCDCYLTDKNGNEVTI
jgi:hypothetical protein